MSSVHNQEHFCFTFDEKMNYVGKFYKDEDLDQLDKIMKNQSKQIRKELKYKNTIFMKTLNPIKQLSERLLKKATKKDYSEGIRIRRLFNDQILELYEFDEGVMSEDYEAVLRNKKMNLIQNIKEEEAETKARQGGYKVAILENREKLEEIVKTKIKSINVAFFNFFSLLLLLFSCLYFTYEFLNIRRMTNDLTSYIHVDALHPFRNENIKLLHHRVVELALANQGVLPYWAFQNKYTKESFLNETSYFINSSSEEMISYQKQVLDEYAKVSKQDQIKHLLHRKWTKIILKGHETNVSFVDFFYTAKSHIHSLLSFQNKDLTLKNLEVNWVKINFLQRVTKPTKDVLNEVLVLKAEVRKDFIALKSRFLMVMLIRTVVAALFLMFLHQRISKEQDATLSCFFSFHNAYIKSMIKKCDQFLLVLETKEAENKNNFNDDMRTENDDESSVEFGLMKKKIENFGNSKKRNMLMRKQKKRKFNRFKRRQKCSEILYSIFNWFNFSVIFILGINYYMSSQDLEFQDSVSFYMKDMADALLKSGQMINRFHFYTLGLYGLMIDTNQTFFGKEKFAYFNSTSVEVSGRMDTALYVFFKNYFFRIIKDFRWLMKILVKYIMGSLRQVDAARARQRRTKRRKLILL